MLLLAACAMGSEPAGPTDEIDDAGLARIDVGAIPQPVEGGTRPEDASSVDAGTDAQTSDPCSVALAKLSFDFESGAQGWTHGVSDGADTTGTTWPYDSWVSGVATVGAACKSGKCFGTELTKNYAQCQRGYLLSPPLDLSACAGKSVALTFQHAYTFFTGTYNGTVWFDGGIVEVSASGSTWLTPTGTYPGTVKINPNRTTTYQCVARPNGFVVDQKQGFVGVQATTVRAELQLPAAAISATTRVRFSFGSGVSSQTTNADTSRASTAPGWRIDDVGFLAK